MKTHLPILFILSIFLFGCNQNSKTGNELMEDEGGISQKTNYDQDQDNGTTHPKEIQDRKIIKTADYKIQVKDVHQSTNKVKELTSDLGGFVSSMNLTNSTYQINNNLVIRVPIDNFEDLLKAISREAIFTNYQRIHSNDVTEEFIDIQTRLKTKKEVRDRYIDILRNKAKTVEEVLKAEEAIRVIQEEIESKEGRLKYLKDQVALSTISLDIYQEVEATDEPVVYKKTFIDKLAKGFENGWDIILYLILAVVNIWPIIILVVLGIVLWRKRKIFRRKNHTKVN